MDPFGRPESGSVYPPVDSCSTWTICACVNRDFFMPGFLCIRENSSRNRPEKAKAGQDDDDDIDDDAARRLAYRSVYGQDSDGDDLGDDRVLQ